LRRDQSARWADDDDDDNNVFICLLGGCSPHEMASREAAPGNMWRSSLRYWSKTTVSALGDFFCWTRTTGPPREGPPRMSRGTQGLVRPLLDDSGR
jgi:hypothetical protein